MLHPRPLPLFPTNCCQPVLKANSKTVPSNSAPNGEKKPFPFLFGNPFPPQNPRTPTSNDELVLLLCWNPPEISWIRCPLRLAFYRGPPSPTRPPSVRGSFPGDFPSRASTAILLFPIGVLFKRATVAGANIGSHTTRPSPFKPSLHLVFKLKLL